MTTMITTRMRLVKVGKANGWESHDVASIPAMTVWERGKQYVAVQWSKTGAVVAVRAGVHNGVERSHEGRGRVSFALASLQAPKEAT